MWFSMKALKFSTVLPLGYFFFNSDFFSGMPMSPLLLGATRGFNRTGYHHIMKDVYVTSSTGPFETSAFSMIFPSIDLIHHLFYLLLIFFFSVRCHKGPFVGHARQFGNRPCGTNIYRCCYDL